MMKRYIPLMHAALKKFGLNLKGKIVLTEAATGNYVVTPVLAVLAGAKVYALGKSSKYGDYESIKEQTIYLSKLSGVTNQIKIINDINDCPLDTVDIVTNTGFLRPIDTLLINKLSSHCVIPLMWEPWEYRKEDIDREACLAKGIKLYGTNESDKRLRTKEYIGFLVLKELLNLQRSPFSSTILLVGCSEFVEPVFQVLKNNEYDVEYGLTEQSVSKTKVQRADVIIALEHTSPDLLIGDSPSAKILTTWISKTTDILHICGNCKFNGQKVIPQNPAPFSYMSFTTDQVDPLAVIDLHTAGLSVAEGMLEANKRKFSGIEYKMFVEENYPALAFNDERFW